MSVRSATASRAVAVPMRDWRVERLLGLWAEDRLGGEWDDERLLFIPTPGNPLTRQVRCAVAGCPSARRGRTGLCPTHRGQYSAAGRPDLAGWLDSDAPLVIKARLAEELCAVVGMDGEQCPRPSATALGLCRSHDLRWASRRRAGMGFEEFLADAAPRPSYGSCTVAACYLPAAYAATELCESHHQRWRREGEPGGAPLRRWQATVPQPATDRVLSLRGLREVVRLEVLFGMSERARVQIATTPLEMRWLVDHLRRTDVPSVLDFDAGLIEAETNAVRRGFARFVIDRVALAYCDPETERTKDRWDLRVFNRRGQVDFSGIRQGWLREVTKQWAAVALIRVRSHATVRTRVQYMTLLSEVIAERPDGGDVPQVLGRKDIERFLTRVETFRTRRTDQPHGQAGRVAMVKGCGLVLREVREMGFLPELSQTFAFRRGDVRVPPRADEGRALPALVVAQLDARLEVLATVPGTRGIDGIGADIGQCAVLVYRILKGTGRRVGEVVSLRLDCLSVDEHGGTVLVYDNHRAGRMGRRLPISDSGLVEAIIAHQRRVTEAFPATARDRLWLFPRVSMNLDGTAHLDPSLPKVWIREWLSRIPPLESGMLDDQGQVVPFDSAAVSAHAFRHTYAQTLADEGVAPSVLRDLMDHQSMTTTLGYYKVGDARKRDAMALLARHTIDNRGTVRPGGGRPASRAAQLREELSWVSVPMGKCSEPINVRAGGQSCPIRYQCAGCPHFESDPSYLPELRTYADQLRREREGMLAVGAADWVVDNVNRQLETIVEPHSNPRGAPGRAARAGTGRGRRRLPGPPQGSTECPRRLPAPIRTTRR